jgi:phage terminase small subunit
MPDFTDLGIDPESGLTLRERAAVDHFLVSLNKTKAYHAAGYAAATYANARKDAQEFFSKPHIRSYLDERLKERADRLRVSADRVLQECCVIAFSRLTDFRIDPDTGNVKVRPGVPEEAIAAVKSVKTTRTTRTVRTKAGSTTTVAWSGEVALWDKMKSIELLAKHLGLVSVELPPLEVLLARLPPKVSDILRRLLAGPPGERPVPAAIPEGTEGASE